MSAITGQTIQAFAVVAVRYGSINDTALQITRDLIARTSRPAASCRLIFRRKAMRLSRLAQIRQVERGRHWHAKFPVDLETADRSTARFSFGGYVVATSPRAQRLIRWLAGLPEDGHADSGWS
jgi:hypothetical protein